MLEHLKDQTETERRQLGEELEDALSELSELEKQEQHSEEVIQGLTQKNQTLEQDLNNTSTELERWELLVPALDQSGFSFFGDWVLVFPLTGNVLRCRL